MYITRSRDFGRERWGIAVQREWFTELDSSTDAKFSRHVTLRLPGRAFACNRRVGAFLASVLASEKVCTTEQKVLKVVVRDLQIY